MKMPWRCFVCGSTEHNCGHREPEIVAHFFGDEAAKLEAVQSAQRQLWSLQYRIRQAAKQHEREAA